MKVPQTQHAAALIRDIRAVDARAIELQESMDKAAFEWIPPEGGWSVGQVFEHLCVANDDYLKVIRPLVARLPSSPARAADGSLWRSSFAGGFLTRSMVSPRKLPAPKVWKPGPSPRPNVIGEFLARDREIVQLIERSSAHDWNRIRLASPVSSLIRMNIGDAFTIIVRHAERHVRQIENRLAAFAAIHRDPATAAR
jgi:hypothetical protein